MNVLSYKVYTTNGDYHLRYNIEKNGIIIIEDISFVKDLFSNCTTDGNDNLMDYIMNYKRDLLVIK